MSNQRTTRTIKPVEEMTVDLSEEKATIASKPKNRSLYKENNPEKDIRLSVAIKTRADSIREGSTVKVNFSDPEDVKQRTVDYLDACSVASVYPTMLGLAVHGFGVSKQALYQHLNSYPNSEETQFLRMVSDMFADILINDSLKRRCDCVSAIFVLKNLYGFRDNIEPPLTDVIADNGSQDSQYYRSKYGNLIDQE